MQALDTIISTVPLPVRQREALISLLADEDPAIYSTVRAKLLAFGPAASQWLRPHTLSSDPTLRRRAREIVQHQGCRAADQRFREFCRNRGEDLDFEEAAGLLAQTRYPDANPEGYRALFDDWAGELRGLIELAESPEESLGTLNRFLFEHLAFEGSEQHSFDPESGYWNRIIDRRVGNPVGLGMVYLCLGRRLQLPLTGIGLPGHFVCRYQDSKTEFYVDPFGRGRFLRKADCVKIILQTSFGYGEHHLTPLNPRRIVQRMCQHLVNSYGHLEQTDEARRVQRYVAALAR